MYVEGKLGVYICRGCGIGDRLDTEALATIAKREGKADWVQTHDCLCSWEGLNLIHTDIEREGITQLAIAACSRRVKTKTFQYKDYPVSRAGLRENVIWVSPDTEEAAETTQEMAADYIRMSCAEAKYLEQPVPFPEREGLVKHLLVVGGGVGGLTAAKRAVKNGYRVDLVEKETVLGGTVRHFSQRVPKRNGGQGAVPTELPALITEVENHPLITIHCESEVQQITGAPERFQVEIIGPSGEVKKVKVGALIQATGSTPFPAEKLARVGGGLPDVLDQLAFEKLVTAAGDGAICRPSDQRVVETIVFIQCAGQRSFDEEGLSYCSGHCCATSIKQALYLRQRDQGNAIIIYEDIRTPGPSGEDFYRKGQEEGVTFVRGRVNEVTRGETGPLIAFHDKLLNEEALIAADLVVLAVGMVPNTGPDCCPEAIEGLADIQKRSATQTRIPILNLDYLQGPDVPHLKYGFADSHFICFPYETRRTGIYVIGPARRPMDMAQVEEDAAGVVLKAIKVCEYTARGQAVLPRVGDLSYPRFHKERCTKCKRCTIECPFGAINEDENELPIFNQERCRRCGTCLGACPVQAVTFANYNIDSVGRQIKSVDVPDEFDEKPRILVFACENDAYPAIDLAARQRKTFNAWVRIIPVRCLGSINGLWVSDAINNGFDGIIFLGCRKGDDYQCHFIKGSDIAHYRMARIHDTMEQIDVEKERIQIHEIGVTDSDRVATIFEEMAALINEIGLSPCKF